MKKSTTAFTIILLALAGGAAGLGVYRWSHGDSASAPLLSAAMSARRGAMQAVLETHRAAFTLKDLQGRERSIADWDGKVILLNFWATWCPPCRREIPSFIKLQNEYGARGLQVVGVANDRPDRVREYKDAIGINYPLLAGEKDVTEIARRYGNPYNDLPYTVFIDRKGNIAGIRRGEITRREAETVIKSLL